MRVLLANKFWYLKGGAERYVFELAKLLARDRHELMAFAMRDPKNERTPFDRFFVSPVATDRLRFGWQGLRTAGRMLWSFEAARKIEALFRMSKPDVLHAHNIYHQLSPSLLASARAAQVPVVMTLHDYHLISPNYGLFDRDHVVEPSKAHPYRDTFARRLIDGSVVKSGLSAFEGWLHARLRVYDAVARFIAPSAFVKAKCVEYGVKPERVDVIPHFIDLEGKMPAVCSERRAIFVGRLSPEKGVDVLIRAAALIPKTRIVIAGDGPERARLESLARTLKASNVEFLGTLRGEALERELARASALVAPSLSYETFGLTALEAYAWGKPVIASRIGGLPEVVRAGETGELFPAGDHFALAEAIGRITSDSALAMRLGRAGRALAETDYAPAKHLDRILTLYRRVITTHA